MKVSAWCSWVAQTKQFSSRLEEWIHTKAKGLLRRWVSSADKSQCLRDRDANTAERSLRVWCLEGADRHLKPPTPPQLVSGSCTFLKINSSKQVPETEQKFQTGNYFPEEEKKKKKGVGNGNHYRKWHEKRPVVSDYLAKGGMQISPTGITSA